MRKFILLLFLPLVFLAVSCSPQLQDDLTGGTVEIGGSLITVEIVDSPDARSQGLMFRENLAKNEGMLFVFEEYGRHSFWMKNTLIPLDIIWIADDKIVHIEENVPPAESTFPPTYSPDELANYVLEVNAGIVEINAWEEGDTVQIELP